MEVEHLKMWKTESEGMAHVEAALKQLLPPCEVRCPIKEDIQRTNVLISLLPEDPNLAKDGVIQIGDYLYDKNPFFSICGYICGLCELECNRKIKDNVGAVKRRLLKRFLSDFAYIDYLNEKEELDIVKDKEDVAIVGGGPAGLMCAYDLSKRGYRVTIFEKSDRLGGALWLIPDYRLPKDFLKNIIDNLIRIARIDVKYGANIGEGRMTLERLRKDGYKAVFLATGAPSSSTLTFDGKVVEGQDLPGVFDGLDFLKALSYGDIRSDDLNGKNIIVIGGGNVAFDAARTAAHLGAKKVTMVYRRSREEMPASSEEINEALEEGIEIVFLAAPTRIMKNDKLEVEFIKMELGEPDASGRRRPIPVKDSEFVIKCDMLVSSIGQRADKALLQKEGLLDQKNRLAVDPFTLQSLDKEWVFVGGDVRRIGFMAEAMQEGNIAAEMIDLYLRGLDIREDVRKGYEKTMPDIIWRIPPRRVKYSYVSEKGLTLKEAIEEAKRCLHCGPCISCKACISIGFQKSLYAVEVDEDRCSGCGICMYACNYGSAQVVHIEGKRVSTTDMFKCKSCGICVAACPSNARRMIDDKTDEMIEKVYANL